MRGNDKSESGVDFQLADVRVAFALLTRLPLPYPRIDPARPAAKAAWAYPIVGVWLGVTMIFILWIGSTIGLPLSVSALLALCGVVLTTGAMHEDGLADCADGFWGGWTPERRLEIMKDSQIGVYGVLALLISFGLRWQLIISLAEAQALIAILPAAILSRSAMVYIMEHLPNARAVGLSHQTGKPGGAAVASAVAIGAVSCLLAFGFAGLPVLLCSALSVYGLSKLAMRKIGGQTGDVLGGSQQITEIVILIAAVVAVHIA